MFSTNYRELYFDPGQRNNQENGGEIRGACNKMGGD
jgi:hypothetical protein